MFLNHNQGTITVSNKNDFIHGETYSIPDNQEHFLNAIEKDGESFYLCKVLPFDTSELNAELEQLKTKEEKTEQDIERMKEIYQEMMN
jgi:hypothetical protein